MKTLLTQAVIRSLPVPEKETDVYDEGQRGLALRLRPSGRHSWRVRLHPGEWFTLGLADVLPPAAARELARRALGDVASGKDPMAERRKRRAATLRAFVTGAFAEWARVNNKRGDETPERVLRAFPDLLDKRLTDITEFAVEGWRTARRKARVGPVTVNRDLDALRSVLSRAVEMKLLSEHPFDTLKRLPVDKKGRVRFLTAAEETRLRAALQAREDSRRAGRERWNQWRDARGYRRVADFGAYTDHLMPLVLLVLNTGLRRGEALQLQWGKVDLVGALLTVLGTSTKTGQTRYLPLNTEAVTVLQAWRPANPAADALVFPGPTGAPMKDIKTAWAPVVRAAKLTDFRFHDLRHTFASKLVQNGIDLNTVRALLGHSDLKMTLRYAHLAPGNLNSAVAVLLRS